MIYDISLSVSNKSIVYPGNSAISITPHHTVPEYQTNLSRIDFGSHTGTHVDAPRHVDNNAPGIDAIPVTALIGRCKVFDMTHARESVKIADFTSQGGVRPGERILLKTNNSLRGFDQFYEDYIYLDGDAADYLADTGISLCGIDYFSIKQRGSSDVRPHTSLLNKGIVVFEGINLKDVPAGEYFFAGLPIKFEDLDGAPARAVLISLDDPILKF